MMRSMRVPLQFSSRQIGCHASRREIVRLLGGCLASGLARLQASADADALEIDRLWDRNSPEETAERSYRVDATILLFSVPMLRRAGVGDARVAHHRLSSSNGANRFALEFAAASDPKRAHGLDRMGWIREVVVEADGAVRRAGVLGIMSDSPEETAEEARTALSNDPNAEKLVAIDSSHSGGGEGRTRSRVIRFRAPRGKWNGGENLPDLARTSFRSCSVAWKEAEWPQAETAPATFLYALKRALERGGAGAAEYVWNQSRYAMRIQREPDTSAGREFGTPVDRVRGELQNITQNLRPLRFQIWVAHDPVLPLPLRIEFQPRSFLRLTLEAVNLPSQKERP
jgi:hypothetical protein